MNFSIISNDIPMSRIFLMLILYHTYKNNCMILLPTMDDPPMDNKLSGSFSRGAQFWVGSGLLLHITMFMVNAQQAAEKSLCFNHIVHNSHLPLD